MNTPYYPPITGADLTPLRVLQSQLALDPDYLSRAECPYPQSVRDELRQLLVSGVAAAPAARKLDDADDLLIELTSVYDTLKDMGEDISNIDAKDKIQWMKAQVSVLERLTDLMARTVNMRQISKFRRVVLELMDNVLEPSQRTVFVQKLGEIVENPAQN